MSNGLSGLTAVTVAMGVPTLRSCVAAGGLHCPPAAKLIVVEPSERPVTLPVLSTEATAGLLLLQVTTWLLALAGVRVAVK